MKKILSILFVLSFIPSLVFAAGLEDQDNLSAQPFTLDSSPTTFDSKASNNLGALNFDSKASNNTGKCDKEKELCPTLGFKSVEELLSAILKIVVEIGAVIAVLMIIYSGFLFVKAQGNPEQLGKAKSAFYTAIIGMAVLLGAQVIANVITSTIKELGS